MVRIAAFYVRSENHFCFRGRTSDLIRDISEVLMFVNLEIIANDVCARTYGSIVTSGNMCTSGENQKSSCEGDR